MTIKNIQFLWWGWKWSSLPFFKIWKYPEGWEEPIFRELIIGPFSIRKLRKSGWIGEEFQRLHWDPKTKQSIIKVEEVKND